ncbi:MULTISPECIES: alpha/beta fold hydrolase [Mycobacterium]|uniref:alpha/beta fold hydrolase n=1 Tax=Mycobacterium TaxID=1763 RepID=UPI0009EAA970|nr:MULTISPECIES: alpha/beta hydrolase [Mycobacterium]MDP7729409.1 alpha/beta hydrolase [Mycobacterium sp. TY813]
MAASELNYTAPPPRVADKLQDGLAAAVQTAHELVTALGEQEPPRPNHDGEAEQLGDVSVVHRFVEAPGDSETVRWHVVESGTPSDPTVVFLHGLPDSWWQWHYALEALSPRYHCLAIDLKGYGQSDKRSGDYRQEGVAQQLGALLDTLQVGELTLITHDRGSPVGDHLAAALGDRLRGYGRGQQHFWHLHPSLHPQQQLMQSPEAPAMLTEARRFVLTVYSWLTERPVAERDLLRSSAEFSYPGIATSVPRYFHSSSFRQEWVDRRTRLIRSWTAPVLLLQGAHDPLQPREFYEESGLLELLPPGSGLHLFDTGHFWPFEAPQETVDVLSDFCDTVSQSRSARAAYG